MNIFQSIALQRIPRKLRYSRNSILIPVQFTKTYFLPHPPSRGRFNTSKLVTPFKYLLRFLSERKFLRAEKQKKKKIPINSKESSEKAIRSKVCK